MNNVIITPPSIEYGINTEFTRDNLITLIKIGLKNNALTIAGLERAANVSKDSVRDFFRGKCYILRADKLQNVLGYLYPGMDFWG